MSKDHSQQDTKLTPNKYNQSKKTNWILQQTRSAVQFYSESKKQDLIRTKEEFIKRTMKNRQKETSPIAQSIKRRKKKKKKVIQQIEKPVRQLKKINVRQPRVRTARILTVDQKQSVKLPQEINQAVVSQSQIQSELSQEGKYELKQIHQSILQMQKIVDEFLDFQINHRRKLTVSQQQLIGFLKTSKYGLYCERFLKLYSWIDNRIYCKKLTSAVIQERYLQTRKRMSQIEILSLLL